MADESAGGRGTGQSPRVSEVLHDRVRAQILSGELAAGDALPSERALAETHGVNRHAVREALKRLEQAGLVRISHGGATRVQDWREHGGLDLLLDLVRDAGASGEEGPPAEVVRSVLELRALIGVDAVRRFAERADDDERREVARLVEVVALEVERGTPADVVATYETLWRAVVAGAGNVAYRLMLNSLNVAVAAFPALAAALAPDDADALRALGAAIAEGDAERAGALVGVQLHGDVPAA
ncbi:FadR/GntR family transcriptional regulator [Patulibacter sp.]|uniref:FadR/GntR family transcriptional regulator n=1 Tax=Patulibacter sp. TaxID=1912859 RepID=UPI0027286F5A|nr:GntR family transcriptional regulator [Patulibacter sp.]MDO9410348.1 GntR family transcriptional regulator [Patulibacter sp.]